MTVLGLFGGRPHQPRPTMPETWEVRSIRGRRVNLVRVGDGTPLVFLHGWGSTPKVYLPVLRAVAARGHQVIAPALPGFGGSAPLPYWREGMSGIAEHIGALLDDLLSTGDLVAPSTSGISVVAHSFGGGVALRLASQRPDLVADLTLFGPVGGGAVDGPVRIPDMVRTTLTRFSFTSFTGYSRWLWTLMRSPVSALFTGHAAHHANLIIEARAARGAGIPVHLVFAADDCVVRPGGLPTCAPGITVTTVPGDHSWLLRDPLRFAAIAFPGHFRGEQLALFA